MFGQGLSLGPLDLLELIDFGTLAVIGAADALGKELLKVRIGHGRQRLKVSCYFSPWGGSRSRECPVGPRKPANPDSTMC